MKLHNEKIVDLLMSIIERILLLDKKTAFEFRGIKLYPSEIHLSLLIQRERNTNATRIAERLAITKGAVSQNISRLEKKGILTKTKDPNKKNELTITFTPMGKEVVKHFMEFEAMAKHSHDGLLQEFSEREKHAIHKFLFRLKQRLEAK